MALEHIGTVDSIKRLHNLAVFDGTVTIIVYNYGKVVTPATVKVVLIKKINSKP